jgi:hypothetical protein
VSVENKAKRNTEKIRIGWKPKDLKNARNVFIGKFHSLKYAMHEAQQLIFGVTVSTADARNQ